MKCSAFKYYDPESIAEAATLLSEFDDAVPLAGGQSLMPMLNFRVLSPSHLIDLNRVGELSHIDIDVSTGRFGAMTRQRDLEFSDAVKTGFPVIQEALFHVGHRQTRNRGTFGGSLCHLDPSAELVNIVALHGGVLTAASKAKTRNISIEDWVLGAMSNALQPGELLSSIELPKWPSGHGYAYEEFARRHGDFAITAVSCLVTLQADGGVARAAICVSGLSPAPIRLISAEALLVSQAPDDDLIDAACAEAFAIDTETDAFVSGAYRKKLASVLTRRALKRALARAGHRS